MKKIFIPLILVTGIYACSEAVKNGNKFKPYNAFCYNGDSVLCPQLPNGVNVQMGFDYHTVLDSIHQPPFDAFSWQTFVALNWPADNNGNPVGNSIAANPNAMRVWEYYKDPTLVFGGMGAPMLLHLQMANDNQAKFLYQDAKIPVNFKTSDDGSFEEADGFPLADRNGNFTLYEIKINSVEDTFITNNHLTTVSGIGNYVNRVSPGQGLQLPISDTNNLQDAGAMEIKASWRILNPAKGDDTTKYYCRRALIYIDSAHTVNHQPLKVWSTVGLVGMHIIRNIDRFGEFLVWSTFEHVDNAPNAGDGEKTDKRWSYYNKDCKTCPVNKPPVHQPGDNNNFLWDTAQPFAGRYYPQYGTQVTRVVPIYSYTRQLNKMWREKLKNTVWANYKLIGTQWEITTYGVPPAPAPVLLTNTTMETYMQDSSGTCIGCHSNAYVRFTVSPGDTVKINTGLSFLFPFLAARQ